MKNEDLENQNSKLWDHIKMKNERFQNLTKMILDSIRKKIALGKKCMTLSQLDIQREAEIRKLKEYVQEIEEDVTQEDKTKSFNTNMNMLNDLIVMTEDKNDLQEKLQKQSAEISQLKKRPPAKPWTEKTNLEQENSRLKEKIRDLKSRVRKYHQESAIDASVFQRWQANQDIRAEYQKIYDKKESELKRMHAEQEFKWQYCAKHLLEKKCIKCVEDEQRHINYMQKNMLVETRTSRENVGNPALKRVLSIFRTRFTGANSGNR